MSTSVTTFSARALPTRAPKIVLSAQLGYLADSVATRGPSALPVEISPALRMEAEQAIPELERLCEPASPEIIAQWMAMVAAGVANTPDQVSRDLRTALVVSTSGDLPRACWTAETRADFARRGEGASFWPSDAEVDAFLRPIGRTLLAKLHALRAVRDKGMAPRPTERTGPSMAEQERDAVLEKFRGDWQAMKADTIAEQEARLGLEANPQPPLRDVTLKGEALRAFRARCGNPVAVPGPTPAADGWTAPESAAGSPTDRTRSVPTSTPAYRAPEPDTERPASRAFPPAMREPAGDDGLDELLPEGAL